MADPVKVIDEFPFTFYGETFAVALASDRRLYVPLRLVCQALAVDFTGQRQRILRDPAISDALVVLKIANYPYGADQFRPSDVGCLRLDRLPYWLGTIDANRIAHKAKRETVIRFKREFADVAWAAFRSEILPADVAAELDASLPNDAQAYHKAMDEAAAMRRGLDEFGRRMNGIEQRVTGLEARLEGTDFINQAQAKQYLDIVGILGELLDKKGKGRGGYAKVHAEVKKVFQVPAYSLIPEARFPDVVKFLSQWHQRLMRPGTPLPEAFTRAAQKRLL